MNRIDRLFSVLLQLQTKKRLRATDLADEFDISKRTVYRDIAALLEMGVPIVSLPGEGYELMPGYYLPPLLFTPDEASAVFLGTQMLVQQAKGRLVGAAEEAQTKIAHVLPPPTLKHVQQLADVIEFYADHQGFDLDDRRLSQIQGAIQAHRTLWLRYFGYNRAATTERVVEPRTLTYSDGTWYLNGFCRLRQDWRGFRLDRIDDMRVQDETFEPRLATETEQSIIEVRIRFDSSVIRWVRERQHYAFLEEKPEESAVVCTYAVHNLQEIVPWLLGWGASAEPLHPPALRQRILQEIDKLREKLT